MDCADESSNVEFGKSYASCLKLSISLLLAISVFCVIEFPLTFSDLYSLLLCASNLVRKLFYIS